MQVGKYAGKRVDQLPNSYLRWMLTQKFPKEFLRVADRKLKESDHTEAALDISLHAIDKFSKIFLDNWIKEELSKPNGQGLGIGSYMAEIAREAWEKGKDVSKHRHADDGVIRLYKGIKWVFAINYDFPDYRIVITVMSEDE